MDRIIYTKHHRLRTQTYNTCYIACVNRHYSESKSDGLEFRAYTIRLADTLAPVNDNYFLWYYFRR